MPELHLQRAGDTLTARFEEHTTALPWAEVAPNEQMRERVKKDARGYGRTLFEQLFHEGPLRTMLTTLRRNERFLLVMDQPEVAELPWEYLRGPDNKLLASRLNFVRNVPEAERSPTSPHTRHLDIVALSISPVDELRVLNTEREWRHLIGAVTGASRALTLTRVRPPTLRQMEQTFNGNMSIVHFMGHSDSTDGEGFLIFEDEYGGSHRVDAAAFSEHLDEQVMLIVLNSCSSAVATATAFGNIAQTVVRQGIPYALGMQFVLPDEAALEVSKGLYNALLQGRTIEEAVRRTRRSLESNTSLHQPAWLAGIPVLYTNLRQPARPITLTTGRPTIQPDPTQLLTTCDLTALPQARHFIGRGDETREVVAALLEPHPADFVVLHGLGGIGKTALARNITERVSWYYGDRVLAFSFETFARLNAENQLLVDEQFAARFTNELARFYGINPANYTTTTDLERAILQRRVHVRSLLVLDNIETLIDALQSAHPAAKALAAFISRLKEGDGAILLTSRSEPPSDWGDCKIVDIGGLAEEHGGSLFLALLPPERRPAALPDMHRVLSRRVQGHPLSIRLLAGRFAEATTSLQAFLEEIEAELQLTEQSTPTSLEDPGRQATLYACMTYSVKRLTAEETEVLRAVSLFQAPFPSWFATFVLNDEKEEHVPADLQSLLRLGLLERRISTYKEDGREGEIELLVLHPMLRWYIKYHMAQPPATTQERYGRYYATLAIMIWTSEKEAYDQSGLTRLLAHQCLADFEAASSYIPAGDRLKSTLAAYLAKIYRRLGQNQRARALYESALEISQNMNDEDNAAVIQLEIAVLLRQQGRPQEALGYCEQAFQSYQERGKTDNLAKVLSEIGTLLTYQGRPQEALGYYEQALQSMEEQGDARTAAVTRGAMANILREQGRLQEAMTLYEQALNVLKTAGNMRDQAIILHEMARLLAQQGRLQEAMTLYEQALSIKQEIKDAYSAAITQGAIVGMLEQQGRLQEAMDLCEEALHTLDEMGNVRDWAIILSRKADLLAQQEHTQEAMSLYEQALQTLQELGDVREATEIMEDKAKLLLKQGDTQGAIDLYEQARQAHQKLGGLGEVAVVEAQLGQIFFGQQDYRRALPLIWHAYTIFAERQYTQTAQNGQTFLVAAKQQLSAGQFDALWEQVIAEPQPDWLREEQADAADKPGPLPAEHLERLIAYTVAVMTVMDDKRADWRQAIAESLQQAREVNQPEEADFFAALLALLDGEQPYLPENNPYIEALTAIQYGILETKAHSDSGSFEISEELAQAVGDFVNSEELGATRRVVEAQQALLFRPEADVFFELLIEQARARKEQFKVKRLELYRALLHTCKMQGIAATFERITGQKQTLPFADLISRSVSALSGSPQEKRAHAQYLSVQANQTNDEELKALLDVIQLALFGGELSQLGEALSGVYRQAWQAIVEGVAAARQ